MLSTSRAEKIELPIKAEENPEIRFESVLQKKNKKNTTVSNFGNTPEERYRGIFY